MADKWVFATKNPHKLAEVQAIVGEVLRLEALPADLPDAEEPYDTLHTNALAKAAFYGGLLRRPVLAEDSGLFVVALGGQPGVRSARYGGPLRLLQAMEGVALRRAYFAAVVVAWWSPSKYRFLRVTCQAGWPKPREGKAALGTIRFSSQRASRAR